MHPVHLLLLFSHLFIIIGIVAIRKANRMRRVGSKAIATVIKNRYSKDSEGDDEHTPIIEFRTDKQELITLELSYGNTAEPKDIGEKVNILYNSNNPRDVSIDSVFRLVVVPWIFIVLGVAGVVLAGLEMLGVSSLVLREWENN
jgi:hypothetical protein